MIEYIENPKKKLTLWGNVIAFDYGTQSMGVAVGQTITYTANPLPSLTMTVDIPWSEIYAVMAEWQPVAWVVGIPYNMDDTEQWMTEAARNFAHTLLTHTHKSVYGIDERLTTREARDILFQKRGYSALKKAAVDSMSAVLILERFLQLV